MRLRIVTQHICVFSIVGCHDVRLFEFDDLGNENMDCFVNKDLMLLGVGAILGFLTSWLAGYVTMFAQFKRGSGWRCVRHVADATREFSKPNQITGALASKYRYGLGTIIDNLANRHDQEIPLLINMGKDGTRADGWAKFNEYIKPVIDTISAYSFPFLFRFISSSIRQHYALIELCDAMELVVMELDSGFENPHIVKWQYILERNVYALQILDIPEQKERILALKKALEKLDKRWSAWLKVVGAKKKSPAYSKASLF